jgi:hypothetical protein
MIIDRILDFMAHRRLHVLISSPPVNAMTLS